MAASAYSSEPYVAGLARAFVGALFFALPLLMTMEMWELGFQMDRGRLLLFLGLAAPLLYGLAYYSGFRSSGGVRNDLIDALAALAVGAVVATLLLALFGVLHPNERLEANVGKVALQTVPAAMGAILARAQLRGPDQREAPDSGEEDRRASYFGELFLMAAGALFFAFNVAPTEEMILISYKMTPVMTLMLAAVSLVLLHLIVYRLGFAGQEEHDNAAQAFFHFSAPGYAIALAISLYVLWTFGRTDGQSLHETVSTMVVLGFPAAVGAALARLVV